MSWVTITSDDVITKLSGPEKAAMTSAALQALQSDPLPEVISQVVKQIRGYVGACARNLPLGDGETIPDELLGAAIDRIRFDLAGRLPVASLLTDDRRTANANALTLLRDVASCDFHIVPPTSPSSESSAAPTPRWSGRTSTYGRTSQDGI